MNHEFLINVPQERVRELMKFIGETTEIVPYCDLTDLEKVTLQYRENADSILKSYHWVSNGGFLAKIIFSDEKLAVMFKLMWASCIRQKPDADEMAEAIEMGRSGISIKDREISGFWRRFKRAWNHVWFKTEYLWE